MPRCEAIFKQGIQDQNFHLPIYEFAGKCFKVKCCLLFVVKIACKVSTPRWRNQYIYIYDSMS